MRSSRLFGGIQGEHVRVGQRQVSGVEGEHGVGSGVGGVLLFVFGGTVSTF
jgi:hypothetical protein